MFYPSFIVNGFREAASPFCGSLSTPLQYWEPPLHHVSQPLWHCNWADTLRPLPGKTIVLSYRLALLSSGPVSAPDTHVPEISKGSRPISRSLDGENSGSPRNPTRRLHRMGRGGRPSGGRRSPKSAPEGRHGVACPTLRLARGRTNSNNPKSMIAAHGLEAD